MEELEKFSYSKLSAFENCGFRYKLTYVDKHFVNTSSIATDFGTLVHYIEETIANDLKDSSASSDINFQKYIDLFIHGNEENSTLGILDIKEKYPEEFYIPDKSGMSYNEKANHYLNNGVYFLHDFLNANPTYKILDTEKEFNLPYGGYVFHGFIDRVLLDTVTGKLIIEDIKTWPTIDSHDTTTPLQFVFYTLAAAELYQVPQENIECFYYLPFSMERYHAGTKGFMKRGLKKIDKLLSQIVEQDFEPNPSPLCHWCPFSKTFPNQPEEAKNLCPYYSTWTKSNRSFGTDYFWMGPEHHEEIMKDFLNKQAGNSQKTPINNAPALPVIEISSDPFNTQCRRRLISR